MPRTLGGLLALVGPASATIASAQDTADIELAPRIVFPPPPPPIAHNEWCPRGTITLDLATGEYMLLPGLTGPACTDPSIRRPILRSVLEEPRLRSIRRAKDAGLSRSECDVVVSNGGQRALVLSGARDMRIAPENQGCWSKEASALHDLLETEFGEPIAPR